MSDILIRGMKMPTSCWDCEVGGAKQMDNATCPFYLMEYWEQEKYQDKIADGCPIDPVPPHERLIDADALTFTDFELTQIALEVGKNPYKNLAEAILMKIDNAPTIIKAEEAPR